MDTALYFSSDQVKILVGTFRGGRVIVRECLTLSLPEGVLMNGIILDEEPLQKALSDLLRQKKIGKRVRISIDSSDILFKTLEVPFLKPAALSAAARQEFHNLDRTDERYRDLIFDYSVLEARHGSDKSGRILCCAMGKSLLESYVTMLQKIGMQVLSCDSSLNCIIKALTLWPVFQTNQALLSFVRGSRISSFLFAGGQYLFSNSGVLRSEPGTDEYAAEIIGRLSEIQQFYKSEKGNVSVEQIYFREMDEQTLQRCQQMGIFLKIPICTLSESSRVLWQKVNIAKPLAFGDYLGAVGCLLRRDGDK